MKRRIIILMAIAVSAIGSSAQNLSESLLVEGHFRPEVISADRLSVLPAPLTLKVPESLMSYDRNGVIASFAPDALAMEATGWRSSKIFDKSKGYVDVRLGSWLNSSLSAGYNPVRNDNTCFNVYLQHNSTSLRRAWKGNKESTGVSGDRCFRYDETIGTHLKQKIGEAGLLSVAGQYHIGYFNYYGTSTGPVENGKIKAPTQTLNDAYADIAWIGNEIGKFSYAADADVRYFGYRAMYLPIPGKNGSFTENKGGRETSVNIGAKIGYKIGAHGNLRLNARYSGVINNVGNNVNRAEIIPSYEFSKKFYSFRLGMNVAVTENGEQTRLRIAPDVMFSARKGIISVSANIGGGTHLRTLAWAHMYDYYSDPGALCYKAAYSPIDADVAFQLNPGGKWTFGVDWRWRTTLDETFGGYYQALLNDMPLPENAFPESGHIHGFRLEVNAGYDFCRYFSLKGKGSWQPQNGTTGFFNGFDRAVFTADVMAESHPIEKLMFALNYNLRAKRLLLPGNISQLNFRGEYQATQKISIGVEIRNLLNRHEYSFPGISLEGINFLAGAGIKF